MPKRRRLILMRHAKSSWESGVASDHERPLNARGRGDAPRVAQRLVELDWLPQWVTSSDATRTRETYELMSEVLGDEIPTDFTSRLYHAGVADLCWALTAAPDEVKTVLALGHNPGWQAAVPWLTGKEAVMKTGCAALLEGQGASWQKAVAGPRAWQLIDLIRPRQLDD